MEHCRTIIIGGGIAGLATAWHLARLGARGVILVEREHALGSHSTAQNAAILRTAIDDPSVRALARRGAEFLAQPPNGFAPRPLLDACGVMILARDAAPWTRALDGRGARISSARAIELVGTLSADHGNAWFFPGEGRVDVSALVEGFADGARAAGVELRLGARVRALSPRGRGVELDDGTVIESENTVIAAGAWAAPLAQAVGSRVELTPTRRHLMVSSADPRIDPRQPILWSDDDEFYARPEAGGLMVSPCDEDAVDPDQLSTTTTALESARAKVRAVMPGQDVNAVAKFWAGLRTHAEDRRFVLGRDADVEGLVWAAGLGGHGITCAAAVGEVVAAAVLGVALPRELTEPFSAARFSGGRVRAS